MLLKSKNLLKNIILIGYSGHACVALDTFNSLGRKVIGYCENEEKKLNPFDLYYFGTEESDTGIAALSENDWFIGIGHNSIRQKIYNTLKNKGLHEPINAYHSASYISKNTKLGYGVMIGSRAVVNPLAQIGTGAIINTGSIIEHECVIGDFAHICPGSVLCGNVNVGEKTFIGANSVVKQGVSIGNNVIIGAGSVVVKDIPDNVTIYGNPAKIIKKL